MFKNKKIHGEKPVVVNGDIGFEINYFEHRNSVVTPHIHSFIEIIYMFRGSMLVVADGADHIIMPGELVLFRTNAVHSMYPMTDNCNFGVLYVTVPYILQLANPNNRSFYSNYLTRFHKDNKIAWSGQECQKNGIGYSFRKIMEENSKNEFASDLAIKGHTANIIAMILRDLDENANSLYQHTENPENIFHKINDAVVYINDHYTESFTALDLATRFFMSYSYFSRNFKRVTGHSFNDFLTITRISHAEKELRSTNKPVTQIALECGYNNVAYFSAMYKKLKGISPTEARTKGMLNA